VPCRAAPVAPARAAAARQAAQSAYSWHRTTPAASPARRARAGPYSVGSAGV